jgi:hypothetical protein
MNSNGKWWIIWPLLGATVTQNCLTPWIDKAPSSHSCVCDFSPSSQLLNHHRMSLKLPRARSAGPLSTFESLVWLWQTNCKVNGPNLKDCSSKRMWWEVARYLQLCSTTIPPFRHGIVVVNAQVTVDKFRKIISGMKLGYGDDNVTTLVHFYDQEHTGKVGYRVFAEDMGPLVTAGVEVTDLAAESPDEKSYYPDNYVPPTYSAADVRHLPEVDKVVFAPVGDGAAATMKAGRGVRVRGRSQAPSGSHHSCFTAVLVLSCSRSFHSVVFCCVVEVGGQPSAGAIVLHRVRLHSNTSMRSSFTSCTVVFPV